MDIIAIILYFAKKYKAALIISIVGLILITVSLLLEKINLFVYTISFIIYLAITIESIVKLNFKSNSQPKIYSLEDKLKELEQLKNEGIITEEEYLNKRKEIIGNY